MRSLSHLRLSLIVFCLLLSGTAAAQDAGMTPLLPQADSGTIPPATASPALDAIPLEPPPAEPAPLPPAGETQPPIAPPTWTWQHQTQNQQGTVTNLHERTGTEDGSSYQYQHSVSRPSGSHTQVREYQQTEDGYSLLHEQRFYRPDGTVLREHAMSVTGTDPYNNQRQMTHTFRDGRTMERTFTRSYDGETGSMEKMFVGPNGQVRQSEHPWTPDERVTTGPTEVSPSPLPTPGQVGLPTREQLGAASLPSPIPPAAGKEEGGFWSRLNPLKWGHAKQAASSSAPKRSGFTVGSFGRSQGAAMPPGLARKAAAESPTHAIQSAAKNRQTGPPAHAMGASRGNAGKTR